MRAIAVHSFAGGFDLGVAQAGWEIVQKLEWEGGFGVPLVKANMGLLGSFDIVTAKPEDWPVSRAELVYGNPPCSGFSALSVYTRSAGGEWKDGRGVDSHLNKGMFEVIDQAIRIRPEVVAFESVAAAGVHGRSLMRDLHRRLEEGTGQTWYLNHVFQDNASIGGASIRRRYHFVATRFPVLGMDEVVVERVPDLSETIGDLADLPLSWDGTPDGHQVVDVPTATDAAKIARIAREAGQPWLPREKVGRVSCRLSDNGQWCHDCKDAARAGNPPPHDFAGLDMGWVRNIHRKTNLYAVVRWRGDDPARVVTGGFLEDAIHPWLDRTFTYREAARIQGFPDEWSLKPAQASANGVGRWSIPAKTSGSWLGKGIPVPAGRWIAAGISRSLGGDPGPLTGEEIGDRERVIDTIGRWGRRRQGHEQVSLW